MQKYILLKITPLILFAIIFLSGCFKTRQDIERERSQVEMQQTLNKNVYEQSETLQQTQTQIGRLQGRIEESEHYHKKEMEELRKTLTTLSEKIETLEKSIEASNKDKAEMFEEVKQLKQEQINLLSKGTSAPVKKKSADKNSFQLGMVALKEKKHKEAVEHFQSYLQSTPKGKSALKASYYLGQAQFALKNYGEAVLAYSVVYEKNHRDPLWKKSALKIAESLQKLGKKKDAKPFAQALVERYPDSTEAKQAKKYLN